jgi:hypothetical protein
MQAEYFDDEAHYDDPNGGTYRHSRAKRSRSPPPPLVRQPGRNTLMADAYASDEETPTPSALLASRVLVSVSYWLRSRSPTRRISVSWAAVSSPRCRCSNPILSQTSAALPPSTTPKSVRR